MLVTLLTSWNCQLTLRALEEVILNKESRYLLFDSNKSTYSLCSLKVTKKLNKENPFL